MQIRNVGKSGLRVSLVGLGCNNFGGRTDRYARAFRKQWDFIEKHLIDPVHGGWFAETTREGTLIGAHRLQTLPQICPGQAFRSGEQKPLPQGETGGCSRTWRAASAQSSSARRS